jgi:aspartate 1-decarboxylase
VSNLVRAVIHNATVTHASSDWPVALRLDAVIMRAAQLLPLEEVEIVNLSTGARSRTYVQPGAAGEVSVFAAASAGDIVSIIAFAQLHAGQTLDHRAKIVTLDANNNVITIADATTQY